MAMDEKIGLQCVDLDYPGIEGAFVVKVQAPIYSNEFLNFYLIYPEDGSWNYSFPVGELKELDELMRTSVKKYFWARIDALDRCELLTSIPCAQHYNW